MTRDEFLSLKPGDKIIANCTSGCKGYLKDNFYQVKITNKNKFDNLWIDTITDSNNSNTNGWLYKYFDVLTPELENYYNFPNKLEQLFEDDECTTEDLRKV